MFVDRERLCGEEWGGDGEPVRVKALRDALLPRHLQTIFQLAQFYDQGRLPGEFTVPLNRLQPPIVDATEDPKSLFIVLPALGQKVTVNPVQEIWSPWG
jgi:hypothetical protein